jgi:hypothetical protein
MPRLSATEVVSNQKAHQHYAAVRAMHRVARSDENLSAWLHNLAAQVREAGQTSKNPQELAAPEGSTAHPLTAPGMRAADGQSDTHRPR